MGLLYAADLLGISIFQIMQVRIGEIGGAATQIAMMLTSVAYLPGIGIAIAGTTLVGQSIGAGDRDWATWLLHSYLFFRIPLARPDRWLAEWLPWVRPLGRAWSAWLLAAVFALDVVLVSHHWQAATTAFSYFFNWQGLAAMAIAATAAKILHEFGHAFVAKHYGVRVPTMGVAFLVMWPVLYTDTSDSWKLVQSSQRFHIAAAGIATELALAVLATLAWVVTPDGAVRSAFFLLATTSWIATLAVNASPFMRFDGYFLLCDALDSPNLHERSFALARRAIRRGLFGLDEVDTEPMLGRFAKRWMIAFAIATWLYRVVLFTGIALLVYHFFFKLLGLFAMAVELWWFIARPVWREAQSVAKRRSEFRFRPLGWLAVLTTIGGAAVLIPMVSVSTAPAVLRAGEEQAVYAPVAARIETLHVQSTANVAPQASIVTLNAPDVSHRAARAGFQINALSAEIQRTAANAQQRDRVLVLQERLAEAIAERQAAVEELGRLQMHATIAGTVRDLGPDVVPGRWVSPKQLLLRIVGGSPIVEAFVTEAQIEVLAVGTRVRFYPEETEARALTGMVTAIDTSAVRTLPYPFLGSPHGGSIAATETEGGGLTPHEALYRIRISPAEAWPAIAHTMRGVVRIDVPWARQWRTLADRALAIIVRESGF